MWILLLVDVSLYVFFLFNFKLNVVWYLLCVIFFMFMVLFFGDWIIKLLVFIVKWLGWKIVFEIVVLNVM